MAAPWRRHRLVEAVARESRLPIVDIRMPPDGEDDGARAAAVIRRERPGVAVMLLSQHVETRHTLDLMASGGSSYLLKDRVLDVDDFLDALGAWPARIGARPEGGRGPRGPAARRSAR